MKRKESKEKKERKKKKEKPTNAERLTRERATNIRRIEC